MNQCQMASILIRFLTEPTYNSYVYLLRLLKSSVVANGTDRVKAKTFNYIYLGCRLLSVVEAFPGPLH